MTQDLLENTNTYLLNATTSDASAYTKNATKNYAETYTKNGQSFNDVFANANDRYANTTNNFVTRDANKNNFNSNLNNRNNNNNNNVADRNSASRNNNNISNNSQTIDNQTKFRESQSNSRDLRESSQEKSQNSGSTVATSSNETNSKEEMSTVDVENLNKVESVSEDDVIASMTQEDVEALNQILAEDISSENEVAQTDLNINAYYQSILDSITSVVEENSTVEDTTALNINTLANLETEEIADTVVLNTADEVDTSSMNTDVKVDTKNNNSTLDDVNSKANTKIVADDNALKTDKLAKEDANGKVTSEKDLQQEIVDKDKKVEVNVQTNETSNVNDDVLVNATDEVVEQVKTVKVNNPQDENKTSFREVMEKAGLDDAKLEALNMTITNAGSAGTDLSDGFQGSAQEDIAKLAINGVNAKKDASELNTNKEFSKLVDTKNMQQEEAKEISKNDILAQINNKMQAKNINGQQRITLQLTPESLGKITIELSKGKDGLQAKMLTDNVQVKDMLEKNVDGLKSTLASQGVTVNNVSVKVASASETASEFDFGRESFNQEQAQQDFADTGERGGERKSQFANKNSSEFATNDMEMPTDETEMAMEENVELNSDAEQVAVGVGNVDIEV